MLRRLAKPRKSPLASTRWGAGRSRFVPRTMQAPTELAAQGKRPSGRLSHNPDPVAEWPTAPRGGLRQYRRSRFFTNHHGWRIGVATDQCRHDGGVSDAQIVEAVHLEAGRINHSHDVVAHLSRANWMIDGQRLGTQIG